MKKYDVIVIGGGFAGVAAALSAARGGANVLIVEKSNCLGGASVNCLVNPFMSTHTVINGERVELSRGMFSEICEALRRENSITPNNDLFDEEVLKLLLNRMVKNAGVELLYQSYLCGVNKDGDLIKSVKFATICGIIELKAEYYIDATGDAQLAFLSECPFSLGRKEDSLCQPMTLCFRVANVDVNAFYKDRPRLNELYGKYWGEGKFINPRENILVFKNSTEGVLHFNTTRVVKKNPTDPFDVTEAEIEAREQAFELFNFLKQNTDSFARASIISTAMQIGVRESRMIVGEHTLTAKEIMECTIFEDSIVAGNYDIDIHNPEGFGTSHYYFPQGKYYTIPYRCLLPKNADNMIVAGRCISSDHEAQASLRIMPIVTCIGQAAGSAASLCVKENKKFKEIDVKMLQDILKKDGAFLGI